MNNILKGLCFFMLVDVTNTAAISAQTNATLQNSATKRNDTPPNMVKLSDVLKGFKTKFDTDILFEDKAIEGIVVSPDLINMKESVEVNLNNLLASVSLGYKKVKEKTYLITTKKTRKANQGAVPLRAEIDTSNDPYKSVVGDIMINGTVKDDKNFVVGGVTITEKGNKANSVISNDDGTFSIKVSSATSVLVFNYEGFRAQEVAIGSNTALSIFLKPAVKELEQVVVVGYGTQKRKDVTGAVASISKDRLENLPNTNFVQALQGAMPGVNVSTGSNNAEGNGNSILVRGQNSIKAGTGPLIILDGVPFIGSMSELNPNDLESIDVLKDASAAAIYGARASGGVIILTTRQGKKGKVSITYDGQVGTASAAKKPDLMNGEQFYNFKVNRANTVNTISPTEQSVYDSAKWVNWYDLALRRGMRDQQSISISGATDKTKYFFNASYLSVDGIAKGDQFKRYSLRSNIDYTLAHWVSFGSNTTIAVIDRSGIAVDFSGASTGATFFNPLTVPYNTDGSLTVSAWPENPTYGNPLSNTLATDNNLTYRIFTGNNIKVDVPFIKGFSYKLNTGVEVSSATDKTFYGLDTYTGVYSNPAGGGEAKDYEMVLRNFTVENIINYNRSFGLHYIGITGLYSGQSEDENVDEYIGTGFSSAVLSSNGNYFQMNQATTITAVAQDPSTTFKKNTLSQMLRVNYGYDSKYLLTLTARKDGFSAFGDGQKYGTFPAIAVGWNVKREKFMENVDIVNSLKLRLSYGLNGNSNLPAYSSLASVGSVRNYLSGSATLLQGVVPSALGNDLLGWESSKVYNVGGDYTLIRQRISGSIDYYDKSSNNLILARAISPVQGFNSVIENIGKVDNKGIELSLSSINIKQKDFTWATSGNIAYNNNKIVDLYGTGVSDTSNGWFLGKPINVAYGYKFAGVYQIGDKDTIQQQSGGVAAAHPGYAKVALQPGNDSFVTVRDKMILGNTTPRLIWGFSNTFRYKNLSLYVFIRGIGNAIKENALEQDAVGGDVTQNTTVKNWWTPTNHSTTHWANDGQANLNYQVKVYRNASFARVQDVTLSFDIPHKYIKRLDISKIKVYATGRNLGVITKYKGIDPELSSQIDVPNQREFVFGLNVGF